MAATEWVRDLSLVCLLPGIALSLQERYEASSGITVPRRLVTSCVITRPGQLVECGSARHRAPVVPPLDLEQPCINLFV